MSEQEQFSPKPDHNFRRKFWIEVAVVYGAAAGVIISLWWRA